MCADESWSHHRKAFLLHFLFFSFCAEATLWESLFFSCSVLGNRKIHKDGWQRKDWQTALFCRYYRYFHQVIFIELLTLFIAEDHDDDDEYVLLSLKYLLPSCFILLWFSLSLLVIFLLLIWFPVSQLFLSLTYEIVCLYCLVITDMDLRQAFCRAVCMKISSPKWTILWW